MGEISEKSDHSARLVALRNHCRTLDLSGFLVPMADEFQNEYVPAYAKRLAWLTGFTGSAGFAVVLADRAAFFTDGRYTLQARDELNAGDYSLHHIIQQPPDAWLRDNIDEGGRIGFDPWLFTENGIARLRRAVEAAGGELVAVADNPVDAVWADQPPRPTAPVHAHDLEFAGQTSAEKRAALAEALVREKRDAVVLTATDSVVWLLNVRGGDVPRVPLVLSYAVLHADGGCDWFVAEDRLAPDLPAHLGATVKVRPPETFADTLARLGRRGATVQVDPATAPSAVADLLAEAGATIVRATDPCQLPKARKNAAEIDGTRAAHRRDGVALGRFLHWIDREAASGGIDELAACERLAALRAEGNHFRDLSFDTISGAGPNGAIVHYRVTPDSNRKLGPGELYLVDSGGQYLDGTTDVTRTVAIGEPTAEMRERFTRVLKGHIGLARARFPRGTSGAQLDALARYHLWQAGLDVDHGTGHGVGSYLGVHEGPQRISKGASGDVALEPGMIVSNEPGYYKEGAYGIRIENLVLVVEAAEEGDEREMLGFETLTFAPIDLDLIDPGLLDAQEIDWLNAYHARVLAVIGPKLEAAERAWLEEQTRPI